MTEFLPEDRVLVEGFGPATVISVNRRGDGQVDVALVGGGLLPCSPYELEHDACPPVTDVLGWDDRERRAVVFRICSNCGSRRGQACRSIIDGYSLKHPHYSRVDGVRCTHVLSTCPIHREVTQ